jgi:hypothetical protein
MAPPRRISREETTVSDQDSRSARLRYTATGALAALAVVGAIAGTAALAAKPTAKTRNHVAVANCPATTKTPASPIPDKTHAPQQSGNPQLFLNAIQRLVDNGTITAAEAQAVDRQIQAGRVDTQTLTGFTQAQIQAVDEALGNTKRELAGSAQ